MNLTPTFHCDSERTASARSQAKIRRSLGLAALTILLISLLFTGPLTAGAQALPQEEGPTCQSCHAEEYDEWKNSVHAGAGLDPLFQEQLANAHNQEECLTCHASGTVAGALEAGSEKVMAEGVTCEACHGAYQEGHPAETTMKLPVASEATCRTCHEAAYSSWEVSKHAENSIECFDCHLAHSQGVRTGSVDTLCAACHSDQGTEAAHSLHGISGVNCISCHMAKQPTATAPGDAGAEISASSHTFLVAADVCSGCHGATIHSIDPGDVSTAVKQAAAGSTGAASTSSAATSAGAVAQSTSLDAKALAEARVQISDLQQRVSSLRDTAVISIGLAFGVGGFMGLLVGIAGMALWKRTRRAS